MLLKLRFEWCQLERTVLVSSLPVRDESIWFHMVGARNDSVFMEYLSLPVRTFARLLRRFSPIYTPLYGPVHGKPGRPRMTQAHQALGVLLMFYASSDGGKHIGLIHHMCARRVRETIQRSEPILRSVLKMFPDAAIRWPSLQVQREVAQRVEASFPLVQGRFGFVDGKNLNVQEPGDVDKQNSMYNGWLHCVLVTGVLVFDTQGLIIWAKHNCPGKNPICPSSDSLPDSPAMTLLPPMPGSWNDGDMCTELCLRLLDPSKTLPGHGLCADTAFPVGDCDSVLLPFNTASCML